MAKTAPSENGKHANKSQAIRDQFAADPKADSKSIISRLAALGVKVSPTMVYYIKSKDKHAKRLAKRERVAESSRQSAAQNPIELVLRVKDIAREVGGIRNLKKLVDLLAE